MPSYPRPHAMVQALAERAEDFILQAYALRGVPLKLRPVSPCPRPCPQAGAGAADLDHRRSSSRSQSGS